MKKKIKDLTFFDLAEICSKAVWCDRCPLHIIRNDNLVGKCIVSILDTNLQARWPEIIEQEVEI